MKFGGWQQCSLIDFPGKISAVLFTEGCSFRCLYCHNPSLVLPTQFSSISIPQNEVLAFLEKRRTKLDGIVISGGEPTLHADLMDFIKAVRALGFAIKLDTNGSFPEKIEPLIAESLVDYWAMDRKASLARYPHIVGCDVDTSRIVKSSALIMGSGAAYEFRTTVVRELHPPSEIVAIASELAGAKKLVLQQFRPHVTLDPRLQNATAYTSEEMKDLCDLAKPFVLECTYR